MILHNINKVLVLGSGSLKIGEAGEFDYSGSQALKALKEEGINTILINPNIATVQTSDGIADKVYFLPVTPYFVEKVIEKERPDGILLAFGGQTALNCGVNLYQNKVLERYDVKVLGTPVHAIMNTEDRELFVEKLNEINVKTIQSKAVNNIKDAKEAAKKIGYPVIVRAAYTLGGLGSGICDDEKSMTELLETTFSYSSQVLVEKSLKGWKEIEYEVMRDRFDNCITICNMENFDPMGIHTGESIVVAPTQTLSKRECNKLRELSIRIIRHIGIVGECNIQYALDPHSEDYRVIEVNARLSRSSALASKATGYPLAFVAAKIALGYGLFDIKNSLTKTTSAFFEPALDYVVCKIPRWDLTKFQGVERMLGSSMKSVGEVMSIGRTFEEAIQKGLRMIGQAMHGFVANKDINVADIEEALHKPTDQRIFIISKALQAKYTIDEIYNLTKVDKWFLYKLKNIIDTADKLEKHPIPIASKIELDRDLLLTAKKLGFSDFQIARALWKDKFEDDKHINYVRNYRKWLKVTPVVKQIDTLAGEYPAQTNYLYLTYSGIEHDVDFKNDIKSIIVLGSGAYRIGSSVEFDWCGVQALNTIRKVGYQSIMINYNPETVSTDYDMCDRLYFDELTLERVLDIVELELPFGVVVSTGGQIPNNLALRLAEQQVPILGTTARSIDNAENRHKFSAMLDRIGVDQPAWKELTTIEEIHNFIEEVGFPVLIRPSYVLSGAAMNVCTNKKDLERFLKLAVDVSKKHPVVVSKFLNNAKEIEFDAVAKEGEIVEYAISEHIEYAGVHSGDATLLFPAQKIYMETARKIKKISRMIAKELNISGPFNIQYLAKSNDIKVIECNLRASRSFPFVSKVLKRNFIDTATRIMLGIEYSKPDKTEFDIEHIGVKCSQFSFARLHNADPVLGVDMSSTGEVGCLGTDVHEAILSAMLSVGYTIPKKNIMLSTGEPKAKVELLPICRKLVDKGFNLFATRGSQKFLEENDVPATMVRWGDELYENVITKIDQREFDLVVNIPKDMSLDELNSDYQIRRTAIDRNIPLITNAQLAIAFLDAVCEYNLDDIKIKSWNEY